MDDRRRFEVIIVGGGIAGASLAFFLAERGLTDVLLLEREAQPGYHSTGRSAASLVELDTNPIVERLKILGGRFLRNLPAGFAENPVLQPSGILVLYREPMAEALAEAVAHLERVRVRLERLSQAAVLERVPLLSRERFGGGVLLPDDGRIDVHEYLTSYLRHARRRGVTVRLGAEVRAVLVERGRCVGVATADGEFRARLVVDAAGGWAGKLAQLAGAAPIRLEPRRRTIVTFATPDGVEIRSWPFVICEDDHLYFAPESGGVLLSPMDEDPVEPYDAQPDDVVIARALDRLRVLAPRLVPRTLGRKWSGLRTFSPDGVVVVGEDPERAGFFWLAGQAGYGIESSGAVGQIAADLIVHGRTDRFDAALLSPTRFFRT
jgi:D-arginine dehydrogenase